jgi:5,10-methylenetetrahydromethanopterin reductase
VIASKTSRLTLGSAVTNVGTRHPTVVASAIRTVQELAPSRLRVGLGVGDSALRPLGLPPTTGRELRAGLTMVRQLLEGGEVDFAGRPLRLRDAAGACPVYVAANGPRNLMLAGELADGVILLSGASPGALERSIGLVRRGAQAAGRDPAGLEVIASAYCHVTDDVRRDARMLKPICATIAQTGGQPLLAMAGIEVTVPAHVPDVYPDMVHAEDWALAVEVAGRWVSDEDAVAFADAFCLFGTVDQIVERIRCVAGTGATTMLVQHVGSYELPHHLIDAIGGGVIPRLREGS